MGSGVGEAFQKPEQEEQEGNEGQEGRRVHRDLRAPDLIGISKRSFFLSFFPFLLFLFRP